MVRAPAGGHPGEEDPAIYVLDRWLIWLPSVGQRLIEQRPHRAGLVQVQPYLSPGAHGSRGTEVAVRNLPTRPFTEGDHESPPRARSADGQPLGTVPVSRPLQDLVRMPQRPHERVAADHQRSGLPGIAGHTGMLTASSSTAHRVFRPSSRRCNRPPRAPAPYDASISCAMNWTSTAVTAWCSLSLGRPPARKVVAGRSIEVIRARQGTGTVLWRSASGNVVAALCCCTTSAFVDAGAVALGENRCRPPIMGRVHARRISRRGGRCRRGPAVTWPGLAGYTRVLSGPGAGGWASASPWDARGQRWSPVTGEDGCRAPGFSSCCGCCGVWRPDLAWCLLMSGLDGQSWVR